MVVLVGPNMIVFSDASWSINPLLSWNTLEQSLQSATIFDQRNIGGTLCSLCQECDHTSSQCALAPLQQQLQPTPSVVVIAPQDVWRCCSVFVFHETEGIVPGNSAPSYTSVPHARRPTRQGIVVTHPVIQSTRPWQIHHQGQGNANSCF